MENMTRMVDPDKNPSKAEDFWESFITWTVIGGRPSDYLPGATIYFLHPVDETQTQTLRIQARNPLRVEISPFSRLQALPDKFALFKQK